MFTINTTPINFLGRVDITKELTISIKIYEFEFNVKNVSDSSIGDINTELIQVLINLASPVLKGVVNLIFAKGINVSWILQKLGLDFIEFEETLMTPMDGYLLFFCTPKFNLKNIGPGIQGWLENSYQYLTSNEVLTKIATATKAQAN